MSVHVHLGLCQMINCCRASIRAPGPIWDQRGARLPQLLENLRICLRLKDAYLQQYGMCKNLLGPQFDLQIFGKFELFCKRLQKLIDVFGKAQQFNDLTNYSINGLESLVTRFWGIFDELKHKVTLAIMSCRMAECAGAPIPAPQLKMFCHSPIHLRFLTACFKSKCDPDRSASSGSASYFSDVPDLTPAIRVAFTSRRP